MDWVSDFLKLHRYARPLLDLGKLGDAKHRHAPFHAPHHALTNSNKGDQLEQKNGNFQFIQKRISLK